MNQETDLVPIADAERRLAELGIKASRAWLYSMWDNNQITHYSRPLDDKRYVSMSELVKLLTPRRIDQ